MKKVLGTLLLLSSPAVFASGSELLVGKDKGKSVTPIVKQVKQVILDDPFLVQSYGALRAYGVRDAKLIDAFDSLFEKDFETALKKLQGIKTTGKVQRLVSATKVYLYYRLNLSQTLVNAWLDESSNYKLNNTQLGVALDQILGNESSKYLLQQAVFLGEKQLSQLSQIETENSKFNHSLQALKHLRSSEKGLEILGKLAPGDPLRYKLVNTVIISMAENNMLAEAGKLVKEVIEPEISKTDDLETISNYYLTLARLLYQAGAYDASKQYFNAIPDESKNFLKSRVEALWVSMQRNDHSVIMGELKSLELPAFEDEFLPELHFVGAMANLQLCQFTKVQDSFNKFIAINKKHLDLINQEISPNDYKKFGEVNFYVNQINKFEKNSFDEIKRLESLGIDSSVLKNQIANANKKRINEIKIQKSNQKRLVQAALRNMRFVKIEFLSTMRRLKEKLAIMRGEDKVSTLTSAIDKDDKLVFPNDGVVFGDELFNMTSKIKSLCLKEKK